MKENFEIILLMIFEYFNIAYIYCYSFQRTIPDFLINYYDKIKKYILRFNKNKN